TECGDVIAESHNHWACGYVNGFAIRVYRNGELTPAAQVYNELMARLEDYPLLDESHHSKLECEEQEETWRNDIARTFENELEKQIETHWLHGTLAIDSEKLRELFDTLRDRGNHEWVEGWICAKAVAAEVSADDLVDYVNSVGFKVFHNGEFYCIG